MKKNKKMEKKKRRERGNTVYYFRFPNQLWRELDRKTGAANWTENKKLPSDKEDFTWTHHVTSYFLTGM